MAVEAALLVDPAFKFSDRFHNELRWIPAVVFFATAATDGKTYKVE